MWSGLSDAHRSRLATAYGAFYYVVTLLLQLVPYVQRAAGKTYLLADPVTIAPTLTRERMITDAEEITAWVRREFDQDKIFVLGHSWADYP